MIGTADERRRWLDAAYPAWEPRTVWGRLAASAERFGDRVYVTSDEGDFTYREVARLAVRMAGALAKAGVTCGMHVGIHLENSIDFVAATYALAILGGVSVLTNPRVSPELVAPYLEMTDVKVVLTHSRDMRHAPLLKEMGIRAYFPEECCAPAADADPVKKPGDHSKKDGICSSQEGDQVAETFGIDPLADSCIIFTSGSTSRSKGVLLSHDLLLRSAFGTCRTRCMEEGRRILLPIPLFHAMGYIEGLLSVVYVGGSIVITRRRFDPERIVTDLKKYRCNDFVCVSLIAMRMLDVQKKRRDTFPDLHAGYWASACPDHVWEEAAEAFGIEDITTAYGMTECGSTTVMMRPEDPIEYLKKYHGRIKEGGAAGIPKRGGRLSEIEIRDPATGKALPPGQEGVIYCRGPVVTRGYDNNPEATRAAIDEDGWFCTDDIGVMNEAGYLRFLGRSDDVYKINGENVSPARIDTVIEAFLGVKEAATVGIPDDRYGFVGVAFVELEGPPAASRSADHTPGISSASGNWNEDPFGQPGEGDTSEAGGLTSEQEKADPSAPVNWRKQQDAALRVYCAENLLHFQVPKYFIYLGEADWIRTSNNKVIKARMKELAAKLVREHPGQESIFL